MIPLWELFGFWPLPEGRQPRPFRLLNAWALLAIPPPNHLGPLPSKRGAESAPCATFSGRRFKVCAKPVLRGLGRRGDLHEAGGDDQCGGDSLGHGGFSSASRLVAGGFLGVVQGAFGHQILRHQGRPRLGQGVPGGLGGQGGLDAIIDRRLFAGGGLDGQF